MYISITGLELKSSWHAPRFWWHAIRSMQQALAAEGNLSAQTRTINGVHHTLSSWRDEAAMRTYLTSGSHRVAMKAFGSMATGKTLGFHADHLPSWDEVHELWQTKGRVA